MLSRFNVPGFVRRPVWLAAWLLILTTSAAAATAPVRIRVGVEQTSPPLSFLNAAREPDGFAAELLRAVGPAGGVELELVDGPWNHILSEFQAGRIDALANVAITRERRATMDFTVGHAYLHGLAFTRRDHPPVRLIADFAGKSVGVVQGSLAHLKLLDEGAWGARIVPFASRAESLVAVSDGQIDFALHLRPTTDADAGRHGLTETFVDDLLFQFHMAVRKGDDATLERLNQGLAVVLRDGTFARIYAKWIGPIEPRPLTFAELRPYAWPASLVALVLVGLFLWQQKVKSLIRLHAADLQRELAERRRLHDALGASRTETMAVMNSTDDLIWSVDHTEFRLKTFNRALGAIVGRRTGVTPATGLLPEDVFPPETAARLRAMYERIVAGEPALTTEFSLTGGERILLLSLHPIRHDGAVLGVSVFGRDITELKRVSESLRESEARFRGISEHSLAGIYILQDERFTYVNPALATIFGYLPVEMIGLLVYTVIHPEDHGVVRDNIRRRVSGETKSIRSFIRGRRKDGTYLDLEAMGSRVDLQGRPAIVGNLLDITERKRAEARLRESEADLRAAQRIARIGSWRLDLATNRVIWSEALYRMLGLDPSRTPPDYTEHSSLFTAESWQRLSEALEVTRTSGVPYALELEMLRPDGTRGWMLARGEGVRDAAGRIIGLQGTAQDITEARQAALARQASDERLRLVMRNLNAGVVVHDAAGVIIFCNEKAPALLGLSMDQILGKSCMDPAWNVVREDGSPFPGADHPAMRALRTGLPVREVVMGVYNPTEGRRRWLQASAEPLSREPLEVICVFHDITRLRVADAAPGRSSTP